MIVVGSLEVNGFEYHPNPLGLMQKWNNLVVDSKNYNTSDFYKHYVLRIGKNVTFEMSTTCPRKPYKVQANIYLNQ